MDYFLVSLLQISQSVFKVFEVKWSYEDKVRNLSILSLLQSSAWIFSTTIGVTSVIEGDIIMIVVFVFSSVLGKILALTIFQGNRYRRKVFRKLKDEK